MNPFKFVSHDAPNQTDKLFTKVQKGEKLTREEKDTIFHTKLKGGDYGYKIMGWCFPFGHYLNTYIIEYKHGDLVKVYAPDKKLLLY